MLGLALLGTSQMHALFQRHPLASNLLEHFSTCLRCTCSIYQLAPHSLQSFPSGLWPLTLSMLPFPKKSKSHQYHLAVPIWAPSTRHFHNQLQLSTFFCGACQVSSGILRGHCFFILSQGFLFSFSKEGFTWFFFSFLPASFLGFAFSTFSKADAGLFSAFSKADACLFIFFSHTARQLANHPFPKIPFAQAFFWQCTLQQRKCLFSFVCLHGCLQTSWGNLLLSMETSLFSFFSFLFESSAALPFSKGSATGLGAFSKASGISSSFKPCCSSEKSSLQSLAAAAVSPSLPSFLTWKRMQEILSILRLAYTWPELEVSFSSGLSANRLISAVLRG